MKASVTFISMSRHWKWITFIWVLVACVGFSGWAEAQDAEVSPLNITIEDLRIEFTSIDRNANSGPSGDRSLSENWMVVTVRFSNQTRLEGTTKGFIDELTIRVAVDGMEDPDKEGFVVLNSEVTFLNVPNGRDHFARFYLYPTAAVRFGGPGARGFRQSNVFAAAIVGGQVVHSKVMKEVRGEDPEWHTKGRQINNMLLPFYESPWWPFQAGSYNQFKR
jgi:hypothetical protein